MLSFIFFVHVSLRSISIYNMNGNLNSLFSWIKGKTHNKVSLDGKKRTKR